MTKSINQHFFDMLDRPFWRDGSWQSRSLSTRKLYKNKLKGFLALFGDLPPSALTRSDVTAWFESLQAEGYSQGHLSIVRNKTYALCLYLFKLRLIDENFVEYVPRYKQSPDVIKRADPINLAHIYDICVTLSSSDKVRDRRDAAIVIFGLGGLRPSNIAAVRLSITSAALQSAVWNEDAGEHLYVVPVAGGKRPIEAVLDPLDKSIVDSYLELRPKTKHDKLFINLSQHSRIESLNSHYLKPLLTASMIHARRKVCKLAGIELVTYQEMRRHMGTRSAELSNVDRAAMVLGHSSTSGGRVIRDHYYDPDTHETHKLAAKVRSEIRGEFEQKSLLETPVKAPAPARLSLPKRSLRA